MVKFGNKYINAKYLNSYTDLISFYTLLKYYPTTNIEPMSYYMFNTNDRKKDTLFVDKDSLKRYRVDNSKISFNKFKTLTLLYDYEKKN